MFCELVFVCCYGCVCTACHSANTEISCLVNTASSLQKKENAMDSSFSEVLDVVLKKGILRTDSCNSHMTLFDDSL